MSKFPLLNRLKNGISGSGSGEKEEASIPPLDPDTPETSKEEEEALKEESRLTRVFELVRNYYVTQKLKGNVYVSFSFLAYGNSLSSDIDGTDETVQVTETPDEATLNMFEKAVLSSTKRTIRNLTNRAMAYRSKPYREDLTLGCVVSVVMPVLGLASFYITISATVHTLLQAHDRNLAAEGVKKK